MKSKSKLKIEDACEAVEIAICEAAEELHSLGFSEPSVQLIAIPDSGASYMVRFMIGDSERCYEGKTLSYAMSSIPEAEQKRALIDRIKHHKSEIAALEKELKQ